MNRFRTVQYAANVGRWYQTSDHVTICNGSSDTTTDELMLRPLMLTTSSWFMFRHARLTTGKTNYHWSSNKRYMYTLFTKKTLRPL